MAPEDGDYEIGVAGDDGMRLFLDGEKVVDDWTTGAERYHGVKRRLKQGERLSVRIDYYQGGGERSLRLTWRRPAELRAAAKLAQAQRDLIVSTYLPKGADWYDFWSNERHAGGKTVSRPAPLEILPLYVRAGSIMPMGPAVQFATEHPEAPYEIRIYPGADARFTIYEDDNETYAYEKGQRATYDLVWNDQARTLSVGARQGSFPGMIQKRQLNLVLVAPGKGAGAQSAPVDRQILYDGEPKVVRF
ncbi:family 31 glycosyl hydrolase, alpha-glucosidase [Caulobacter sp. AP07]|nr:family 31 glycosyl hydrolase, alpha-glucosidase [Caulobacter sp. AP07]